MSSVVDQVYKNKQLSLYDRFVAHDKKSQELLDKLFRFSRLKSFDTDEALQLIEEVSNVDIDPFSSRLVDVVYAFTLCGVKDLSVDAMIWDFEECFKSEVESIRRYDRRFLRIKTNSGEEFNVYKLSAAYLLKDIFPDIDTVERKGKCHARSYYIATRLGVESNPRMVTGAVWKTSPDAPILHSWTEYEEGGSEYVINYSDNAIYPKELYYRLYHPEVISSYSKIELLEDSDMIRFFNKASTKEHDYLKLYLVSRDEAVEIYRKFTEGESGTQSEK